MKKLCELIKRHARIHTATNQNRNEACIQREEKPQRLEEIVEEEEEGEEEERFSNDLIPEAEMDNLDMLRDNQIYLNKIELG